MKIALLGAASSGKTVYFSALYYRYRNVVSLPRLSASQRADYSRKRINKQIGFRLRIDSTDLDAELSAKAELLMQRPITNWPDSTDGLDKADIQIQFDFVPISKSSTETHGPGFVMMDDRSQSDTIRPSPRSYQRSIEIYDPSGGALKGKHRESEDILSKLETCDIAIVFLPADKLLDAINTDDPDGDELNRASTDFLMGKITEILAKMKKRLGNNDTFPVCFIVSKFDEIPQDKVDIVNNLVYDQLLIPFSEENPEFMICICPISIVDPVTHNFKARNLEWPFLFAAGGTIFRNSQVLRKEAKEAEALSAKAEARASELLALRRRSLWQRFSRWIDDDFVTVGSQRRAAAAHYDNAGRKVMLAANDADFARDIWSSIAAEGKDRGVYVLWGGESVDPRVAVV
jgi:hypothetical protein